jgi:hypothetical protein
MAKVSLYLDMRAVKDGQPGPLKIKYFHKGTTIMLPTTIRLTPDQWMTDTIINHPKAKQWNTMLRLRMVDITSEILELEVTGRLGSMTPADLKKRLMATIGHSAQNKDSFLPVFTEYVGKMTKTGTISIWNNTLNRLKAFCDHKGCDIEDLTFNGMTPEWMEEFDAFMAKTAPKANARAINHRNVRTVFNYAKKLKKMDIPYPYDTFKIKHQETRHQDLTIEQTRTLKDYPLAEDHIAKSRDIYMLMIYLRGINSADLFEAKKEQIINGRLEYYRRKTGAFCSVKIEPEAQAIIDRYAGDKYILDIAERWSNTTNYLRRMDKYLKRVGPVKVEKHGKKTYSGMFDKLASNGARHTWASLTFELGHSEDTASDGLTHKFGHRTTNIYVNKRYQKNVDKANRDVIDYIFNKEEKEEVA